MTAMEISPKGSGPFGAFQVGGRFPAQTEIDPAAVIPPLYSKVWFNTPSNLWFDSFFRS
jgi:hypothetical protein